MSYKKKIEDFKVAVVGATGNVGREMLSILAEHDFPMANVTALASPQSNGREVSYGEKGVLKVQSLEGFNFSNTHITLFSAGASISQEYVPMAAAQGSIAIDNTSFYRMDPDVPLVVPEVNVKSLEKYKTKRIIANPNCSTIQLVMALKPLHQLAKVKRVVVSTYQSVSGAGKLAMDELHNQVKLVHPESNVNHKPTKFLKPIAFNVIPQIDAFMEDGQTKEEWKMIVETQKILDPSIHVSATCVRVPVFIGHSLSVNIEFHQAIDERKARESLSSTQGICVIDSPKEYKYVTPLETAGEDFVYISRIRKDHSIANGLNLWVVADNLRKGAALNSVQIAQSLIHHYL